MRFLLDESSDFRLKHFLAARGHDVSAISTEHPAALQDEEVLAIALAEQRILITNDRDFGELVVRYRLGHCGVVLFRLSSEDLAYKQDRLGYVLDVHGSQLSDALCVVADKHVRIRRRGDR